MKYYIGIDNGVTGSVCVLDENGDVLRYAATPVKLQQDYTKDKKNINRVIHDEFEKILQPYPGATVILERPMINASRFNASVSAIRCDEAQRGIIEKLRMKLIYVDSKEWQEPMLPNRKPVPRATKKTSDEDKKKLELKRKAFALEGKALSLQIGQRLFPMVTKFGKDADAALIAEWARREKL